MREPVDAEELANHVDELELRLERLRVLYDQYFMGIEKVPPNVPQKDVDRRIWVLRREKIRNTGVRFKFQTIVQRYSTFMSYWQRILREIENGTYKRHVQRAKRRFGEDALAPSARAEEPRDRAYALDEAAVEADTFDVDLELDDVALPPVSEDLGVPSVAPPSRPLLSPLGTMRQQAPLPSAPAPAAGGPTTNAPSAARAPGPPPKPGAPPLPSRVAQQTTAVPQPAPQPAVSSTAPTAPRAAPDRPGATTPLGRTGPLPATPPPSPSDRTATTSDPLGAAAPTRPVATPAKAPATTQPAATQAGPRHTAKPGIAHESVPRILAAKVRTDDDLDAMLDDALGAPKAPAPKPAAAAAKPAPNPAPSPPPNPSAGAKPAAPTPVARPAPVAPVAARPAAPAARPSPAAAPPAAAGGGDYRAVYARYVESRRSNGESTAGLTYESLAKNLRDTTEKLKSKSGGKPIDFEVVVKDGKTILKPVVK